VKVKICMWLEFGKIVLDLLLVGRPTKSYYDYKSITIGLSLYFVHKLDYKILIMITITIIIVITS